ncbi:hypothetical protein BGZ95_000364, partial [Linnemannia exigua]
MFLRHIDCGVHDLSSATILVVLYPQHPKARRPYTEFSRSTKALKDSSLINLYTRILTLSSLSTNPFVIKGSVAEHHHSIPISTTTIDSDLQNAYGVHHSTTQANASPVNDVNTQAETFSEPTISNSVDFRAFATPLRVRGDLSRVRSDDRTGFFSTHDLEKRLEELRLKMLKEPLEPVYIPLRAKDTLSDSDDDSSQLMEKVQVFLYRHRSVFLLLGNSGTGKSTFLKRLEQNLWSSYKKGGRIPLHIDLPSIDKPERNLIEKQLQRHHFLDYEICELLEHRQFVLICDGYDECRLTANLYTANGLNLPGQQDVKMIISCRSTFLGRDYHGQFQPHRSDPYRGSRSDLLQEATILPFTKADITTFAQQYLLDAQGRKSKDNQPTWTASHFMKVISTIPDMPVLVRNPFLLSLALDFLPSLPSGELASLPRIKATRVKLLSTFFDRWIEISKVRLERTILSPRISAVFEKLRDSKLGFEGCVERFLIRLAEEMYENQMLHPIVEYEPSTHRTTWKAEFFARRSKPTLLREASPLTKTGNQHRFVHHAFFTYFRFRAAYPDGRGDGDSDSDDDDSDGYDSDDDDSNDEGSGGAEDDSSDNDGDTSHCSKGHSLRGSEGMADGDDDGGSSGSNDNSTGSNGGSRCTGGTGGNSSSGGNS